MKKVVNIALLTLICLTGFAHGGEDHGAAKPAASGSTKYFSSEALSDKYEVLVKYGELQGGQPATFQLFLAHAKTNRALDSATITIKLVGGTGSFMATRIDTGVYKVTGTFPANQPYDLQVNINGPFGPDFLQVPKIEVGKKLAVATDAPHNHWYEGPVFWAIVGVTIGLLIMFFIMRSRYRKVAAGAIIICLLAPASIINPSLAHEGEDHGGGAKAGGGLSSSFTVEKESQFLFDILTHPTGNGNFYQSEELLGTVTAAPQGSALIQSPQTGKIISLRVTPGQTVAKGQALAVVEQNVDAGTQINVVSERNRLNAELKAAKAQYDRLQSIADIAAKKDVIEARARYEAAAQNYRLFNANVGAGSTKLITLTAPIGGVVGTFNYAIGAVVSAGQTLFDITNLQRVYVETQVFGNNMPNASDEGRFVAFATGDTVSYALRMVSNAQTVNTDNQSQRVVFEVVNANGKFKIGENVRVLRYGTSRITQLVVPTSAIVDVNGKSAVFIKDRAEQYSISFIQKGESNPLHTVVAKGVETGERIVTGNVYQMKMIYLGQ